MKYFRNFLLYHHILQYFLKISIMFLKIAESLLFIGLNKLNIIYPVRLVIMFCCSSAMIYYLITLL